MSGQTAQRCHHLVTCAAKSVRGRKLFQIVTHWQGHHRKAVLNEYQALVQADERKKLLFVRGVPIQQAFESRKKFARDGPRTTAINDKTTEHVAIDDQPSSVQLRELCFV